MNNQEDKPDLGNFIQVRFGIQFHGVVFSVRGHGTWGVEPSEKTEELRRLLEEVYSETVAMRTRL